MQATSLLLEAQLCSVHALLLGGLQLQLPDGFLEVVRKVQQPGSPGPGGSVHGGYPGWVALLTKAVASWLCLE